jgi:hypothetical protein
MIILKSTKNLNLFICEEEFCEEEGTKVWASSESRIVDLCEMHYAKVKE